MEHWKIGKKDDGRMISVWVIISNQLGIETT
jgi:hypothetical protein